MRTNPKTSTPTPDSAVAVLTVVDNGSASVVNTIWEINFDDFKEKISYFNDDVGNRVIYDEVCRCLDILKGKQDILTRISMPSVDTRDRYLKASLRVVRFLKFRYEDYDSTDYIQLVKEILTSVESYFKSYIREIEATKLSHISMSTQEQEINSRLFCSQRLLSPRLFAGRSTANKIYKVFAYYNKKISDSPDQYFRKVFISYAWPLLGTKSGREERTTTRLHKFLKTLRKHLRLMGIDAILDIVDNRHGMHIGKFMEEHMEHVDNILLMGTPSLLKKHLDGTSIVCMELARMRNIRRTDRSMGRDDSVLPIILSGDIDEALPAENQFYATTRDWQKNGYCSNLKGLMHTILGADDKKIWEESLDDDYNTLMKCLDTKDERIIEGFLEKNDQKKLNDRSSRVFEIINSKQPLGGAAEAARSGAIIFNSMPDHSVDYYEEALVIIKKYNLEEVNALTLHAALIHAVNAEEVGDVKILTQSVEDINALDTNNTNPFDKSKTALHYAVIKKSIVMITSLLKAGALYDIEDGFGKSALDYSLDSSDLGIKNFFLKLSKLPLRNQNFIGRASELDQITHQLESNHVCVITQSVAGLGGVGKSSLVLEYAHRACEPLLSAEESGDTVATAAAKGTRVNYDYIVWLSAREPLLAFSSFAQDVLGLDPQAYRDDHATFMRQIYIHLSQAYPNVLLVLDDVINKDKIELFLPKEKFGDGKLHILMTTRSAYWTGYPVIELSVFDPADAIVYILKLLNKIQTTTTETQASADELAQSLGYFPLALSQAIAYIQQTDCSIKTYLERYVAKYGAKAKPLKIDSENTFDSLIKDQYHRKVYAALCLSIASLSVTLPKAEDLLNICAYYGPDPIPNRVINRAFSKDDSEFKKILRTLRDYSLIAVEEQGNIQLHQLLQEMLMQHLKSHPSRKTFNIERAARNSVPNEPASAWTAISAYDDYFSQSLDFLDTAFSNGKSETASKNMPEWRANAPLLSHVAVLLPYAVGMDAMAMLAGKIGNSASLLAGEMRDFRKMKLLLEYTLKINELHYGMDDRSVAITLNKLGCVCMDLGDHQEAQNLLQRALIIQRSCYPSEHIEIARTLINLSEFYGISGNIYKQVESLQQALKIQEDIYLDGHVEVATTLTKLGNAVGVRGDLQQEISLYERALKVKCPDNIRKAFTYTSLGNAYILSNKPKLSEINFDKALKIIESHYGEDHLEVAKSLGNLANAYCAENNFNQQVETLKRARKIQESYYGVDHVEVAMTRFNLGLAELSLKNKLAASDHLTHALRVFKVIYLDHKHPYIQKTHQVLQMCQHLENEIEPQTNTVQSTTISTTSAAALFGAAQRTSPLSALLLDSQKQIPEPDHVQLIFKTETEAKDCQRQLQSAVQSHSAAAAAASMRTDFAIEKITLIDENEAGTSAASTAAAVQENYAITLTKADYNQILGSPSAYDELETAFRVTQEYHP